MATKRKVPTTKAGKPDKRYVKSVNEKSKATGKAPTKRTQKRRAKPQIKGYSANPSKSVLYIQEVKNGSPVGKKFYYIQLSRDYYGSGIGFVENKKDASNVPDPESVMKRVFAEWNKHYAKGSKDYGLYYSGK